MTPLPRQGWFFQLNFENRFSQNTGKCELGGFSLRQSHIVKKDLLLTGSRLIIPLKLRTGILNKIHTGHQGITKHQQQISQSVWWPRITKDFEDLIS